MLFAFRDRSVSAFTLIELLTVIVIVSLLAAIALGEFKGAKNRAALARARTELIALSTALEDFKRVYGDYPQLGPGDGLIQAAADPGTGRSDGPGLATVQAKLFNCLTGVFGARGFDSTDRQNGPCLLDPTKFALEGKLSVTFQVPQPNAPDLPFKNEENIALLDPWGRRYLYYYKNATRPGDWLAPAYLLYSAGPDGKQDEPPPPSGIITDELRSTVHNSDNLYAGAAP